MKNRTDSILFYGRSIILAGAVLIGTEASTACQTSRAENPTHALPTPTPNPECITPVQTIAAPTPFVDQRSKPAPYFIYQEIVFPVGVQRPDTAIWQLQFDQAMLEETDLKPFRHAFCHHYLLEASLGKKGSRILFNLQLSDFNAQLVLSRKTYDAPSSLITSRNQFITVWNNFDINHGELNRKNLMAVEGS